MAVTRNEIIVALIGMAATVSTGLISNWDKITSTAHQPTNPAVLSDDINVQLRYFVETSGLRTSLEAMDKARAERLRLQYKADKDTVNCMQDVRIQNSQLIDVAVEALKGHVTLEEIKELNRINASPAMINFAAKQPAITLDMLHGIEELSERMHRRNLAIAGRNSGNAQALRCPSR